MLIATDTAQRIIENHATAQSQSQVAIETLCKDATGKDFIILQFNNGACSVGGFAGKLVVNLGDAHVKH